MARRFVAGMGSSSGWDALSAQCQFNPRRVPEIGQSLPTMDRNTSDMEVRTRFAPEQITFVD